MRIGYCVLPPELVDVISTASSLITRHPPSLEQIVLTDFITQGHLARHIRRMRTIYIERQADLIEAAERELAGVLEITPPEAGTHLVGWLPRRIDDQIAVAKAAERGVEAKAFSTYCMEVSGRGGLVLGYGAFTKSQIRAGMQKLATALSNCETQK